MGNWNQEEVSGVEDEPKATETFDSDHEDDDDESADEYEDEIDEIEDIPFWRQHFFAIVIAFVASTVVHFNNQTPHNGEVGSISSILPRFVNRLSSGKFFQRHDHLNDFSRTANISFCYKATQPSKSESLRAMDFYLPREHFEALQGFYIADQIEDDSYSKTDIMMSDSISVKNTDSILKSSLEFQCLLEQHRDNPLNRKFKGISFFYKDPSLEEIYQGKPSEENSSSMANSSAWKGRKRKLQQPPLSFTGFATKVVNLDTQPVLLYWDGKGGHENSRKLVGEIPPMESIGTATMPGHSFHVTPIYDPSTVLKHWVATHDSALFFYDPKSSDEMKESLQIENPKLYAAYHRQMINKAFSRDYTASTGRTWLAQFPRPFPMHYMHGARYIGQKHQVDEMTLKVVSVRPRVFTIENFLTIDECKELIRLGLDQGLTESTLHASPLAKQNRDTSTRSSTNAWLSRATSTLTEKIYKKAARLTKIDENLFQNFHDSSAQHHSIAESLQVVRYKKGEEYTPHHDFISPSINNRYQPSRFATLLIYLNDVKEGGETRFPRAVNDNNSEGLEITPKAGSAVLFYSSLEDGNFDDLSQHGGNKVLKGNKWLANLWVRNILFLEYLSVDFDVVVPYIYSFCSYDYRSGIL